MIGTKLSNRYEIVREIGRGGMGVVYLARDPVLDREVAVKVVTPEMMSTESAERFRREARVVAKMDHPAIVTVYDSGEHNGSLFFVMPFVEGTTLRSLLRNQTLRLGDLIDMGIHIAEALEYSHVRGVVHRDIKPENIMVTREGDSLRVRVTDFGLAMVPSQDRLTKKATVVGTAVYMSPEQVSGREVDARSDIYSLGTVLYECLVGQTPFAGEVQALVYRISHEIPVSPRNIVHDIDTEVEEIILRCLEKDPAKRPTGKEVSDVLIKYRMKLQSSGRNRMMLPSATTMSFQYQRPAMRPFVGRDKEFADLQRRLNAAIAGECQFVLLGGEAGIGKTRLLEELETLARVRLIAVYHGRFVELTHPLPYQGYCEAIQEYFRLQSGTETPVDFSDLAPDLISLFPVLAEIKELSVHSGETARPLPEGGAKKFEDRTYIFELLARALTRMAAGKPFVLLLEDLHAADVSIEALDYIVRRLGPTPTFIVGSYRTTEVDKRHPIMNLLSGFKGDKRFGLIQLSPLSPSSHRLFLEGLVGGAQLDEALAKKFFEATEGNPYFTAELVRSLIDSGGIIKDDTGVFKLSSETALSIEDLPVTIQQTIEERIERLPKELREILSIASVLGKTLEFANLETLASEVEDLENGIEHLVRAGFVEEDRQSRADRLSFSSGVVRDVLYGSLPRRKRRSLHRKHAEELERRNLGRLERVYPQLFEHYGQAGVPAKVIEYGFLLAKKSLESFSPEDAMRVLKTVLDFLEEEPEDSPAVGEAKILLASAYRMAGSTAAALEQLEEAANLFEKHKQAPRLLDAVLSAVEVAWQGRKVDETRKWVERGLDLAQAIQDTNTMTRLLSLAATVANLRGEYQKAHEYLEEVEKLKPTREESREEGLQGGTLTVALPNPCQARHPANAVFNEEAEVLSNVFETLVTTDSQGNLIPYLCERWETSEEGALFLFFLRNEARLHDGKRLTAQDVKDSFENAIQRSPHAILPAFAPIRGVAEFLSGSESHVSGVVAPSENMIEVHLRDRLPIYPALLTDSRTGIAVKGELGSSWMGTGPFRISTFASDSIILERTPDYWKGKPPLIDAIQFRVGLNSTEVAEGFRSGRYDLARDLLPQDLEEILRDQHLRATLVESPKKNTYFVLFNASSPLCRNAALRQAMAGIVRTHDLVRSTLGRFAEPAEGILAPGILGYDPGRRRHSLTREKAEELIRSTAESLPIRLNASVHPLIQDRYSSLVKGLLKAWSDIGIEISIKTPDITSYNDSFEKNEGIDLLIGRWISDYDDPDSLTYSLFHSEVGEFRAYHHSKEMDQLMVQARAEMQPDVRERLYRRIDQLPRETSFLLPLFHEIDYRIATPKVRKLTLSSIPPYVNYAELAKAEAVETLVAVKTERGVLSVPILGELVSLDPSRVGLLWQGLVVSSAFETLTRAAEGARVVPWLASAFQAEEGGRKFRFFLRDSIRFHDGRRVTARDVRYSFEHLLQNTETNYRFLLSPIRGAKDILNGQSRELAGFRIISALEFVVELEQPLSFFPALLTYTSAAIVPEGAEQFVGSWRAGCVGTGPFRVTAFDPGRTLKVEANPGYWRAGLPRLEAIEFTSVSSPSDILAGFKSGRFSLAWDLFPSDAEALLHEPEYAAKYREIPMLSTYYLVLNKHLEPLVDEKIRHRLIDSIDVAALVRRNLGRLAIPAYSFTPSGLLGYEPAPRVPSATISRRQTRSEMELTAMVHSIYESRYPNVAADLFQNLAERGFRVKVVETKGEFHTAGENPTVHMNLQRWMSDYPDADTFMSSLLHSQKGDEGSYCGSPEMDGLIERGRTETDPTIRHSIYRQIEEMIRKQALILPLFHEQAYCFSRPKVEGLELSYFAPYIEYEKIWIRR